MATTNPVPDVVDIVGKKDGKYIYNYEVLKQILTQKSVKDSPIAVYSVCGHSGNGKSFLFNIFSHFMLQSHSTESRNEGEAGHRIFENVFDCRNSIEPTTKGIRMTKTPFWLHTEKQSVAVFLVDAEGSHALKQEIGDELVLFVMCNVLSSFQIINFKNIIDRNLIEELGTFANVRSAVQGIPGSTELLFLIRDWEKSQHQYGLKGGNEYMSQLALESMEPMRAIKMLYEVIQCFLLPHPGSNVARGTTNNLNDIDDDAMIQLTALFNQLFCNNNLVVNTFNGEQLNGQKLLEQLNMFEFDSLLSDSTQIKNVFEGAQEKNSLKTVETSVQDFRDLLTQKVLNEEDADLEAAYDEAKNAAMACFGRLTEKQRNKFQPRLDKKLLKEKMEVEKSLKAVKRILESYRDIMEQKVVNEEDGDFVAARDQAEKNAILQCEMLSERQRNICRPILNKELLNENKMLAKNVVKMSILQFTEGVNKIGKFSPGKVNKLFKTQGQSSLSKLKTCLGDGDEFHEAKNRLTECFDQTRKEEFSARRRNKRRLVAVSTAVAGAIGGGLLILIPPIGAAVVASAVAVEVATAISCVAGGTLAVGAGVGIDFLATDDDKPDLVEPLVGVDNNGFSSDKDDAADLLQHGNDV